MPENGIATVLGLYVGEKTRVCSLRGSMMAMYVRECVHALWDFGGGYEVGRIRRYPGPMIVPFQLDMRISSPSSRP